jgi:HJR/Mrr/RecB family endonuclease
MRTPQPEKELRDFFEKKQFKENRISLLNSCPASAINCQHNLINFLISNKRISKLITQLPPTKQNQIIKVLLNSEHETIEQLRSKTKNAQQGLLSIKTKLQYKIQPLQQLITTKISEINWHEFEHFCLLLINLSKNATGTVTGSTNDGGIDIIAETKNEKFIIQCKHYNNNNAVGAQEIQQAASNLAKPKYANFKMIFITTSRFTNHAQKQSKEFDRLELWDSQKLQHEIDTTRNKIKPDYNALNAQITEINNTLTDEQITCSSFLSAASNIIEKHQHPKTNNSCAKITNPYMQYILKPLPIGIILAMIIVISSGKIIANTEEQSIQPEIKTTKPATQTPNEATLKKLETHIQNVKPNTFHDALPHLYKALTKNTLCNHNTEVQQIRTYIETNTVHTTKVIATFWEEIDTAARECK